jgi:putative ABC transport system permease protein
VNQRLQSAFPSAGFKVEDRLNAAPGTRRFLERLGQFLTLVGLSALIVAGVGVGNGVASYLDGKRNGIAVLKMLGATSGTIFRIYLLQIALVALFASWRVSPRGARCRGCCPGSPATCCRSRLGSGIYPAPLLLAAAMACWPPSPSRWCRWRAPAPSRRPRCCAAEWRAS